ncbi:MAG: Na+/H+ antiporter NhaC family protein, partial [Muribaculaceae bacterium]|nr:Na+/H+ antiporter NhaC family protein [Muribaculaceae bacterium]
MNDTRPLPGLLALSPVIVFAVLYLGVSIAAGDFYAMPLSLAFVAAGVWAVVIGHGRDTLAARIETFSRAAGSTNILGMVWIFILAGAFADLARSVGAIEATVSLALSYVPGSFMVPGLFVAACFISMSIGTSVGTVVALTPLAVEIGNESGVPVAMLVAALLGGAFFGDNLSFISDTTIAATRSQSVPMNAKFRANIAIVLPAALIALLAYIGVGAQCGPF